MTCTPKEYIYIFKGDDTNWNNEQFLTVNITSQTIDLSTMTAKFILGSFSQTFPLTTGSFEINLSKAVTGAYSFGPINGVIQILDSESRVKTVSNTIPFHVTNKVQDAQNATFNVQVSENSPIEIDIQVGGGGGGSSEWGQITGTLSDQTDLQDALNAKMNTSGGTFTGDVDLASGVSLNTQVGQIHDVNDNVVLGGKGTNYGLYVATDGSAAALVGNGTLKDILTTEDVKSTYSATGTDPVNGTAVAIAISGKQDALSQTQLDAVNSGIDSTKVGQIATNTTAIAAKQPKTLDTPITVGGVSQTTVEGALGAINTNTDGALKNKTTASNSLNILGAGTLTHTNATAIGISATQKQDSVAIGYGANCVDTNSVALGRGATARQYCVSVGYGASTGSGASRGIAIGYGANANAASAIQLGQGTNSTASTFQVYSYTMLDGTTGLIPSARIPTASSSVKGGIKLDFDSETGVLNIITE